MLTNWSIIALWRKERLQEASTLPVVAAISVNT